MRENEWEELCRRGAEIGSARLDNSTLFHADKHAVMDNCPMLNSRDVYHGKLLQFNLVTDAGYNIMNAAE
jgi:hypothetical protein